ncbi:MAG: hypothetical protein E7413_03315 [Ruminococcaceae bacterium]|nr:hypothetical protein [Oscillospiraceae bacterium]
MIEYIDYVTSTEKIGGKAYHLSHLFENKFPVPNWIVLSSDVFFEFLGEDKVTYTSLLNHYTEENRVHLISLIKHKQFSDECKQKILNQVQSVFSQTDLLAVRSSATDEDGDHHSFAGMMESFLNVTIEDDIFDAIKACYLSCFSERIMKYRAQNGLINANISVAVILQKMITPDVSGVMFTSNPRTNNPEECLICVVKGLGERLVSGEADSTDYVVNQNGEITVKNIADELILSDEIIKKIHATGIAIEKSYSPRVAKDIEFCLKDNELYILQARTIATYSFCDKNKPLTILDNSNIIESYSGVTTPLTYTFAKDVYTKIYNQTLKSFFVKDSAIKSIQDDLANMIVFYENKIYYRLNSWYKMTALYPGYEKNKKYMENMMGVKVELVETKKAAKIREIRIYTSFIKKMLLMKRHSKKFIEKFNAVTKPYYGSDFKGVKNTELLSVYNSLETEILDDFITPIANDMGAMIFYGFLTNLLKKQNIQNYEGLISAVISKQGNVESAQQSEKLLWIIKQIKNDQELSNLFLTKSTETIIQKMDSDSPVFTAIREYIYQYGARMMDELKLETITLFEDPTFLIETIKHYLCLENSVTENKQDSKSAQKELLSHFGLFQKPIVSLLVNITKFFVKNRESLRLRRTYIYSIVRSIYLRAGQNLYEKGVLLAPRDVFYLTKEELTDMMQGAEYEIAAIRNSINNRKAEYTKNKDKITYERMHFYGEVCPENALAVYSEQECVDTDVLQGVAGGGTVVEGTVKLVEDPAGSDVTGYILMAKRTDPGWTVLFPMAKAIIIERGSILSHSAVVAREMGLTLVAGIRGLTNKVKDGMRVRVDGINGTVEIIDDEQNEKQQNE